MGKRRKGRELALQYLYQWDFHGPESIDPLDCFWDSRTEQESIKKFAINIIDGVKKHVEEIDKEIESQSKHWKLYRMSRIDRNILRIAVFEFVYADDVPPKVSIDEAIEIGKKFGTSESGAFINGILDQISKKLGKIISEDKDD